MELTKHDVMCATCGFEVTNVRMEIKADIEHREFDPAHEPNWYEDDKRVKW